MPNKQTSLHHKKRHGHHHRRSKLYHKVYLPYLPLVVSIFASLLLSGWSPKGATLAYATNTSIGGLLSATNAKRAANGQASLSLNSQLNSAAQAKANDMVARDYWSHNTPDGQEPWVFVDNAGYKYLKAGENLAYGFSDSDSTVTGWMNSPSHKANMLDSAFLEVGFGFANSADFNDSGPETVVVAMYGKPQTLASTAQQPAPAAPAPAPVSAAKPATAAPEPAKTPAPAAAETKKQEEPATPAFTTDMAGLEPVSQPVTRVAALTGSQAPLAVFAVGIVLGLSIMALLMKHALQLRHLIRNTEKFVLHHPLFDSTVVGLVIVGITLLQNTGFIK
jgi:uncharacterized protein YkwD